MRLGILTMRRRVKRADIADTPFSGAPDAFVLYDITGQNRARVKAIGYMREFEHTLIIKTLQMLAEGVCICIALDLYDFAVLDGQTNWCGWNAAERWRYRTVKNDRAVDRAKAWYDVNLAGQHMDTRHRGVSAVAGGVVVRVNFKRDVTSCRSSHAHAFCSACTLGHSKHEAAQFGGINLPDRAHHKRFVKIDQAHVA